MFSHTTKILIVFPGGGFFKVADRDPDLLNSKQLMRGSVLRFPCAFRL
jgi:hypothetical protein